MTSRGTIGMGAGRRTYFSERVVCQSCAALVDEAVLEGKRSDNRLIMRLVLYGVIAVILIIAMGLTNGFGLWTKYH